MTAEVAVMNRSAVALAADSAVTLSASSGVTKIFQNENKLFELSRIHPVGVMLYNATTFFDVPWEIIIKDFRKERGDVACDHINSWADCFRDYVNRHDIFKPDEKRQKDFVEQIFTDQLNVILAQWSIQSEHLFFEKQTKSVRSKYPELMKEVIASYNGWLASLEFYVDMDDAIGSQILQTYSAEFASAKGKVFGHLPLDETHQNMLSELGRNVLVRSIPDWFTTGLVFSGFGQKELFPSLSCIELSRLPWLHAREVISGHC